MESQTVRPETAKGAVPDAAWDAPRRPRTVLLGVLLGSGSTMEAVSGVPSPPETSPPTLDSLRAVREALLEAARRHGAFNLRVFGSVARGESTPDSDIDFLVDMASGRSLFDLAGLWRDLESILQRPVDVVSAGGLTDRDDDIRAEAVPL